jgi:uncharacterized membrane protein
MVYYLVIISIIAMSGAQLLLKKGLLSIGQSPHSFAELAGFFIKACTNIYIIFAVVLTIITALSWLQAASKAEISHIYPFMALSYVLVAIVSIIIFKENVTAIRWLGIAIICVGVFLVYKS